MLFETAVVDSKSSRGRFLAWVSFTLPGLTTLFLFLILNGVALSGRDVTRAQTASGNNSASYQYRIGNYQAAIELFTNDIKKQPSNAKLYVGRGLAYDASGRYEEAIEDFSRAIDLQPRYALAYYFRGMSYSKKGDWRKAIDDISVAITINPDDAGSYYSRGKIYLKLINCSQSIDDFTRFIQLRPQDDRGYYLRAKAYYCAGDIDHAIKDLQVAAQLGNLQARDLLEKINQ